MPSQFVQALKYENLCTFYLLPLIQLSKFNFGEGNFLNSYANHEGTKLAVELADLNLCESFAMHPEYLREERGERSDFIYFELPDRWQVDFGKFKAGKYSEFSEIAKEMIYGFSGLTRRNIEIGGDIERTDARLLALTKDPSLKAHWENELQLLPLGDQELMFLPGEQCFIDIQ